MRIVSHSQHLTGVGHFVVAHAIACELAKDHDVFLVDGGRPVPRASATDAAPTRIQLPILRRVDGELLTTDDTSADAALLARAEVLAGAVEEIRPDAVIIEHYPFSKWELEGEIVAAIDTARRVNPDVRILCSLRDIAPRTRYEHLPDDEYSLRVLSRLHARFDGLAVHADPRFTRLNDHFPGTPDIEIPVVHTGFVVDPTPTDASTATAPRIAVASCGGLGSTDFLLTVVTAFNRLASEAVTGDLHLHVFAGLGTGADDLATLARQAGDGPVEVHEFGSAFASAFSSASLSISRCGYNTGTELLRSRIRALVVPDASLADQRPRAALLADAGLATMLDGAHDTDVDAMADAITRALRAPVPEHDLDLDGAAATGRFLEQLVGAR